ncbi:MAG: thiamine biosynthesis protein ThiF [Sulfurimonas sp.]|nr:thiamine biosynthesis protein ThiF [Sulfurimonas sp.]
MIHGFDKDSPLVCEGIVGDGCGGGRIFSIEKNILKAFDPQSQSSRILLEDIIGAKSISKKGCIITIVCEGKTIEFDLSSVRPK